MRTRLVTIVLCLGVLAGCGQRAGDPTSSPAPDVADPTAVSTQPSPSPTESPSSTTSGTRIVAEARDFGTILFDATGQAIYLFDVETTSTPRCYGACAQAWPPVLTTGRPRAGAGADTALLDTTEREDGSVQVTYADHPLYFYAHEGKHEVLCHDVVENGGTWYAVQPDGTPAP